MSNEEPVHLSQGIGEAVPSELHRTQQETNGGAVDDWYIQTPKGLLGPFNAEGVGTLWQRSEIVWFGIQKRLFF